ncbi:antirestriction protein [Pseudoxanthomonas kaohsiungensis]|uniref:Antirestriction protein n=1 Tax=Pseudoxanthomonas kaohsiungensis TaxID=283923 RepID=A0ABW3LYZ1_9GAMM|nr:antirestriction protein [Pseudoxanthomonas kaohsiungensis]
MRREATDKMVSRSAANHDIAHIKRTTLFFLPNRLFEKSIEESLSEWTEGAFHGGQWLYLIENGACYLAPVATRLHPTYSVKDSCGTPVVMSAQAAGLAATIYNYNRMAWEMDEVGDEMGRENALFHWRTLMAHACTHPEAGSIMRLLD